MKALGAGDYALSALALILITASLAYGATHSRRLLAPTWEGPPALLATTILFLTALLTTAAILGTIGLFEPWAFVLLSLLIGIGGGALARRHNARVEGGDVPSERFSRSRSSTHAGSATSRRRRSGEGTSASSITTSETPALLIAGLAVAATTAIWMVPTIGALITGPLGTDTMWYHQPQAARFVQEGSIWALHFTDPFFLNWFYPSHSELLHGIGMLITGRDFLSPLVNLAFLGIGLLAAWCAGRPFGIGPHTLTAGAAVFSTQMIIDFQPGEARNDAIGLALVLAALALTITLWASRGEREGRDSIETPALILPALAAGLAIGTKLNLLATIGVLTLGVVLLARPGARRRVAGLWLAGLALGGAYWYVRNLIHAGNPLPWISSLGPIDLPGPADPIEVRPQFAVAHYATDLEVWRDWFGPGLKEAMGPLWPGLLAGAIAGALHAALAGGRGVGRLFGVVVGVSLIAYVFTPLTASGPEGMPVGFAWNLRYIAPALGAGLVLLALAPVRSPGLRAAGPAILVGLAALTVVSVLSADEWDRITNRPEPLLAGALVLAAFVALAWIHRSGRRLASPSLRQEPIPGHPKGPTLRVTGNQPLTRPGKPSHPPGTVDPGLAAGLERRFPGPALAIVVAVAIVGGGYAVQRSYMDGRYADVLDGNHLDRSIAWANGVSDARIATAGRGGIFYQYGFYGADLSNHVQWVGRPGPAGSWMPILECSEWRTAVNGGGYDYVVTTYDERFPGDDATSREREWIRRDPSARELVEDGPVAVFELTAELDEGGCGPAEERASRFGVGANSN